MKLISSCGRHDSATYKKPNISTRGIVIALSVALYAIALCGWFISPVFAETAQQAATEAETAENVEESVVIEEETVEIVAVDETLALAIGIDAVVSSVPGGDLASDVTMIMVGNVILNRTNDSRYPDTVDQVLCQPYQFSCFAETGLKWVGKAATDEVWKGRCKAAAARVMNGERLLSHSVVYVSGGKQGIVEAQLDGLYFCK